MPRPALSHPLPGLFPVLRSRLFPAVRAQHHGVGRTSRHRMDSPRRRRPTIHVWVSVKRFEYVHEDVMTDSTPRWSDQVLGGWQRAGHQDGGGAPEDGRLAARALEKARALQCEWRWTQARARMVVLKLSYVQSVLRPGDTHRRWRAMF